MRHVQLDALISGQSPEIIYDSLVAFDRYPELAPHVQSTLVHQTWPEPTGRSTWALHFRSGLLRWTEQERFLRDALVIEFEQEHGDFDEFTGRWTLRRCGEDTEVHFAADFDFGIPSLEGILDPIAEQVLKESVAWVLVGMFDEVHLDNEAEPVPIPVVGAPPRGN